MPRVEQICHREDSPEDKSGVKGGGDEQIYLAEVFAVGGGGGGRPAVPFIGPGNCTESGTHCCWASSIDKILGVLVVLFFLNFPLQKFLLAWSSQLLRNVTCLL